MVDALGGDTEAIEKAASLAGISNYGLVDINTEVFRILNQKLIRILEPLLEGGVTVVATASPKGTGDSAHALAGFTNIDLLRRLYLPHPAGDTGLELNIPRVDYLYDGPSQ